MLSIPPSGTVTFLFTDIQGSTLLWQQYPQAMAEALAQHHFLLRKAVEENKGYVFQIIGDAFCVAFANPVDGVNCALAAQRALRGANWGEIGPIRVRMALHTGSAELKAGDFTSGEYASGLALSRAARLLSAGHGEQVLISETTYALVKSFLLPEYGLRDLGEHRLKDLQRPERIFQLICHDLPADFPPLKTLNVRPNNLPTQLTSLVGREQQVERITHILLQPEVHLLTLTGPGGTGKTRLGLRVAAELVEDFQDGAFFVPLASINDAGLVAPAIAQALSLREQGNRLIEETIQQYLSSRQILLLLDNFEQVIQATPLISSLLAACAGLKILVTSRTSLRLRGEHEFPVTPLSLPAKNSLPPMQTLAQIPAVALFVERATAMKPDFQLTPANASMVVDICTRLEGLPLAIELAVAHIKLLPPQAILSRLKDTHGPQRLLTRGASDLPERQRTLQSTLDWSYQLLTERERRIFRIVSVFNDGFTLDAATEICCSREVSGHGALDSMDLLDGLESLIDKSLLRQVNDSGNQLRFYMLELIREYALGHLNNAGEMVELRRAHAAFFLQLAERAAPELELTQQAVWLNLLEAEHGNFRAALGWLRESGDVESGLRMASALGLYYFARGYQREGLAWLVDFLAFPERGNPTLRAKAFDRAGLLARYQGAYDHAQSYIMESLTIRRQLNDLTGTADSLANLGYVVLHQGNHALALQYYQEALMCYQQLSNQQGIADSYSHLAILTLKNGDFPEAERLHKASLDIWRELKDQQGIAYALCHLGEVAIISGKMQRARGLFNESLEIAEIVGFRWGIVNAIEGIACIAASAGEHATALHLAGGADHLRETANLPSGEGIEAHLHKLLAPAYMALGKEQSSAIYAEGRLIPEKEIISQAYKV